MATKLFASAFCYCFKEGEIATFLELPLTCHAVSHNGRQKSELSLSSAALSVRFAMLGLLLHDM
jgi:hypothetical protein